MGDPPTHADYERGFAFGVKAANNARKIAEERGLMPDTRQSTHWQGCWKSHHACAVALLDKILREDLIGPDEARRLLAEAKRKAGAWDAECEEFGCHDTAADLSSRPGGDDAG